MKRVFARGFSARDECMNQLVLGTVMNRAAQLKK